jgi:cytochrome c oxidase subunit III
MEVGTADIIEQPEEKKRGQRSLSGGGSPGPGGRHGGGGGGGDRPDGEDLADDNLFIAAKSRILTGFLLIVVLMTFGGLMAAYVVIATNNVAEWKPFALPVQVWISTFIIVASSVTYHLAKTSLDRDRQMAARKWLIATTVLGGTFISSQILAWVMLSARGLYVQSNPYAGFFYILTAVHAVHVIGGITALGTIMLRSWYPTAVPDETERRRSLAQVVGWYWHFMGAIWMVLFVLLGFWK